MKSCLFVLRSQKSALPGPSSPPQHSADIDSSCSLLGMLRSWAWMAFHMGGWQSISYLSVHQNGFWSISIWFIWILGVLNMDGFVSQFFWVHVDPMFDPYQIGRVWKSSIPSKWRLYYGWIWNQLVGGSTGNTHRKDVHGSIVQQNHFRISINPLLQGVFTASPCFRSRFFNLCSRPCTFGLSSLRSPAAGDLKTHRDPNLGWMREDEGPLSDESFTLW